MGSSESAPGPGGDSVEIEFVDRDGYLEARASGKGDLQGLKRVAKAVAETCKTRGFGKALVDLRNVQGFERRAP